MRFFLCFYVVITFLFNDFCLCSRFGPSFSLSLSSEVVTITSSFGNDDYCCWQKALLCNGVTNEFLSDDASVISFWLFSLVTRAVWGAVVVFLVANLGRNTFRALYSPPSDSSRLTAVWCDPMMFSNYTGNSKTGTDFSKYGAFLVGFSKVST